MTKIKNRKITIRDVAELVGVHHSTVSRALNPNSSARISPEMVRKINRASEKLGYYPNIVASSLKQNRSFALGVLIPDLVNPVFPPMIRGIQDTAEKAGFTVLMANTDDEPAKEQDALKMMIGRSVEGLIVATARRDDPLVDECINKELPFVLVNRTVDRDAVNGVIIDEEFGMRSTLDHLIGLGHTRIANIPGPQHTSTGFERATAFANYMKLRGLDADLIVPTDKYTVDEGRRSLRELLRRDNSVTAIVAGSDIIALGCLDAMGEAGILCPENISIVGNNDILFLSRMNPALTTISIPKYEMGAQAASILLDEIDGTARDPMVLRMQPKLVVRNSTAPLTRAGHH